MSNWFWIDVFALMFRTIPLAFLNPFFWIVIYLVISQYRRAISMEQKLFGQAVNNVWEQTFASLCYGFLGGLFGSFFLVMLGISLDSIGIYYILPIAVMLLLINPRFLCFAYAGGIVALSALTVRALLPFYPGLEELPLVSGLVDIHIPSMVALVGILHLTEALLIYISGHRGASPLYLKDSSGKIIGGYSMQRFWPLPLVGLIGYQAPEMVGSGISMPDWWPLFGSVMAPAAEEQVMYMMVPVVAGLGYSDIALSNYPHVKRVKTALHLALYSIVLCTMAVLAVFFSFLILPAALLAPLGHEYLVKKGNNSELAADPLFSSGREKGLYIMDIVPQTLAETAGLKRGDRLLEVNEQDINSELDFWNLLRLNYQRILLKIDREGEEIKLPLNLKSQPVNMFGAIFVPKNGASAYVEMKQRSLVNRLFKRKQE